MGKIKEILIAPHTHHDMGYTHLPSVSMNMHVRSIYRALDLCEINRDDADPAAFCWTIEISHPLQKFLQQASATDIKRLQDLVARKRIAVTAGYMHMSQLTGHEEYVRFLMPVRDFRLRYGLPVSIVEHGDINGLSWGFVPLMNEAGLDTLVMTLNPDHGRAPFEQPTAFTWEGPDGSRILAWLSLHYGMGSHWGVTEGDASKAVEPLSALVARANERDDYPFDFVVVHSAEDNRLPSGRVVAAVQEWNNRNLQPPMRFTTIETAMDRARAQEALVDLPVYRGEWADWWAHGHVSSANEVAIGRQAESDLRSAETFHSLAQLVDPATLGCIPTNESPVLNWYHSGGVLPSGDKWQSRVETAYENLILFEEHTWGSFESVTAPFSRFTDLHWQQKASFAGNAAGEGRDLAREALANLSCALPQAEELALVVANPLSISRDELITLESRNKTQIALIRDLPPLGVRAIAWSDLAGDLAEQEPESVSGEPDVVENQFYRLEIDPASASIISLYDKELGREWVDKQALSGIGGVVYEEADREDMHPAIHTDRKSFHPDTPGPRFKRTAVGGGSTVTVTPTSFGARIMAEASGPYLPRVRTTVTLYNDLKRIDLTVTVDKQENYDMEGVYVLFPFALDNPTFLLETANAVYRAGEEQLPDTCVDWYSIQHGAGITDGASSVLWATREAPVVQLGGFHTGEWTRSFKADKGHLYSWLMNNLYFTNFKAAQGGHTSYNFRFTTVAGAAGAGQVRQWGEEFAVTPLARLAPVVPGAYSWLSIEPTNVQTQILKAAYDQPEALILRLKEVAGQDTTATLRWNGPGEITLFLTDLLETSAGTALPGDGRSFQFDLRGQELATLRLVAPQDGRAE